MKRWKIWLGIVVIFLSGMAIGAFGTVYYVHRHIRSLIHEGPEAFNRMMVLHLDHELDLTEEQGAAVADIVAETHLELMQFRTQHDPSIQSIVEKGINRMKTHLDVKQQARLDALHVDFHANLDAHHQPHHDLPHQEDGLH